MQRLIVGTRKGLFIYRLDGGAPRIEHTAFLGVPVPMLLSDPRSGSIFAGVEHGHFGSKLHRSVDGGKSFEACGTPTYPEKPEGLSDTDGGGREIPWDLKTIWALEAAGADQPGRLWCGTIPGGLFRSDDDGASWSLVRSLWDHEKRQEWFGGGADYPGIHSVTVDPRDSKRVGVGVSCGGFWVSEDDGESWSCRTEGMFAAYMPESRRNDPYIQDPHRVVRAPSDPDTLWCQHHNGAFVSTDGAKQWRSLDIPPSSFGFAVAVHPKDPKTAWFVPATKDEMRIPVDGKVVVSKTMDGGESFEVMREGLPQEHAYDIAFRHALDVDETGEVLAFGTTTGALFVSKDGGRRWTRVSAHLPPVYCVGFEKPA